MSSTSMHSRLVAPCAPLPTICKTQGCCFPPSSLPEGARCLLDPPLPSGQGSSASPPLRWKPTPPPLSRDLSKHRPCVEAQKCPALVPELFYASALAPKHGLATPLPLWQGSSTLPPSCRSSGMSLPLCQGSSTPLPWAGVMVHTHPCAAPPGATWYAWPIVAPY